MRHFKNKIPVWFRGDSTLLDEEKNGKSFIKNVLLKWVYRNIDIAFYTGTNNKEYFLKYGLKNGQLIQAFHAIDNERFQNSNGRYTTQAQEWKNKLKISPDALVFLYAGKLEHKKGVETLLKAFMFFSNVNCHLVIVGNGTEERNLKTKYTEADNVTFLDFQNQKMMPVIYQLCDVFVLPSIGPGESWGLAINEAMAAGKVIVASDKCGGAIDLITNGENGYIFKAGNTEDLVLIMKNILDERNKIRFMQENSLKKIEEFCFENMVTAIESIV
jgi:glycosyltransferase involved in cell wall biosynthesis